MKKIINTVKSNKVLIQNFTSLSLLQISNYIFPLITLPYLVRVLTPENFGLVSFIISFISYFNILIDYGFNLSATKQVSQNRSNNAKLSEIFSNIFYARILLLLLCLIIFFVLVFSFSIFKNNIYIYLISFSGLIGTVFFPLYFFQGTEKMQYIFSVNFFVRALSVLFIFLFIKQPNDYVFLVLIYSAVQILIGLTGFFIALKIFSIKVLAFKLQSVLMQLKNDFNIFISSLTISLLTNSNAFILGLFADNKTVGYFAGADKIRIVFQSALLPILTTSFARITKLANESLEKFKSMAYKSALVTIGSGLILSLIIFTCSTYLVKIILGEQYKSSDEILCILSALPFLYSISNFIGVQIFIPLGKENIYSLFMTAALTFHTIMSFTVVPILESKGSAIAMVFTELLLVIVFAFYIINTKTLFSSFANKTKFNS